jgi:hypothetical protein
VSLETEEAGEEGDLEGACFKPADDACEQSVDDGEAHPADARADHPTMVAAGGGG